MSEKSLLILTHFSTIKECNRQTDKSTDRRTDGIMLAYAALAYYTPHSKSICSELPEEKVAITLDFQRVMCEIKLLSSKLNTSLDKFNNCAKAAEN